MTQKHGIVTAAGKMTRTITVTVHHQVSHPLYKKSFRSSKKFMVDTGDIKDIAVGDEVTIQECRPLSKNKHFKLLEVTKRVPRVSEMVESAELESVLNRKKEAPVASTSSDKTPSSK